MQQFPAVARRLGAERRAAYAIVRRIRKVVAEGKHVFLPARWITVGVADGLVLASQDVTDELPEQALALARLARSAATRLDATYPHGVKEMSLAPAYIQLATLHRRSGNPELGLPELDRADLVLESGPRGWMGFLRASVAMERARTLYALGRSPEALAVLHIAAAGFEEARAPREAEECAALIDAISNFAGIGGGPNPELPEERPEGLGGFGRDYGIDFHFKGGDDDDDD